MTLVALSPQLPEHSSGMIKKHALDFELLHDPGNEYAAQLGLRFDVPANVVEIYKGFGIDLEKSNGDDSLTLPMPARLVVDASGIVRATDISPNYTQRPEPEKTLDDVKGLG